MFDVTPAYLLPDATINVLDRIYVGTLTRWQPDLSKRHILESASQKSI